MSYKRLMIVLVTCVLSLGLVAVPAYASKMPIASARCSYRPVAVNTFDSRAAMILAADTYAKSGPAHIISAAVLHDAVLAHDASYQIVDVRSAAHYALGHIDGAINIPFQTIADDASLAKLDRSKKIVVVCYTGETASMTTMVWGMLGYNVRALLFGMSGWVADKAIVGLDFPTGVAAGYPTTTPVTTTTRTDRAPEFESNYANVADAVKGQTKAYFAKNLSPVMTAAQVHEVVVSRDSHYQLVSVRQTPDYATGHIKGAVNLVWSDIALQTAKLDPKKTTIVYCYTGNLGGEDTMFLNLMGYEAYNMMSGMSSWNNDAAVGGVVGYNPALVANYPTVK